MKPGELARIVIPVPSLFESIEGNASKMTRWGDIVLLLKHEPASCHWPCWRVLYDDQIGIISSRWLKGIKKADPITSLNRDDGFDDGGSV